MFLHAGDDVIDLDLDLLVSLVSVIDQQISRVEDECEKSPDADAFGLYDRVEGLVGLGFVACQQYIHMTYRQLGQGKKWEAIKAGRMHAAGLHYAEIVNAAANFWKHHGEWAKRKPKPTPTREDDETRTRAVLDRIFPSSGDYPLSNVLHGLLTPEAARFASVIPLLEAWRNALIGRT